MIEEIKKKFARDEFEFSKHAADQSILREISVQEIRRVIKAGEIIEDYPHDKYGPSCLILGFTLADRPLHVQCSYPSRPVIKVITVYEPDPDKWIEFRTRASEMATKMREEEFVEQQVTYTLFKDGKFYIIERVPARVNVETGEQFFSPQTVEQLQRIIWEEHQPARFIQTPVFEFA